MDPLSPVAGDGPKTTKETFGKEERVSISEHSEPGLALKDEHACPHRGRYFPFEGSVAPTQHTDKRASKTPGVSHREGFPEGI